MHAQWRLIECGVRFVELIGIGFGGESGGPAGEKAGALEFRRLKVTATP